MLRIREIARRVENAHHFHGILQDWVEHDIGPNGNPAEIVLVRHSSSGSRKRVIREAQDGLFDRPENFQGTFTVPGEQILEDLPDILRSDG